MASKNKLLPRLDLRPRLDMNKEVTESAGGPESASSTKVLRLLGLNEMPYSMNFPQSENTVSSIPPTPESPSRKNDRKSLRIRSTNVLRMFKMPDGVNTRAPGASDPAIPPSPTADFSESLSPLDTAPPISGGSALQSEQSPTIGSSGEGKMRSMMKKLKLPRSASTGTAPPGIDLSVLRPTVVMPLPRLTVLTNSKESDTDFAPFADSVISAARLLPIQATPEGGTDVEPSARPMPSDAVPSTAPISRIPTTSNTATKPLSTTSAITPTQSGYPIRRSSIKPYGSFPIQRPSVIDGASRPPLVRNRSRSQPAIMHPTTLNAIADDEASMMTKHTPTPGHSPKTVAPRRQSVDSSSRHDMSVLLQQLSLLESKLLADGAPSKPTVLEPKLEDLEARDITAEPFNTKAANESTKALPDIPKEPEGDHVAKLEDLDGTDIAAEPFNTKTAHEWTKALPDLPEKPEGDHDHQTPKEEQKRQLTLPSVPVEFSDENTTTRLSRRPYTTLSSPPALPVPHVAAEPPVTSPKESTVQQGNPWDDVLEIYGPGGDEEKRQSRSTAKSNDGLSDVHMDIMPIFPANDDIKLVEHVNWSSLEVEKLQEVFDTFADKKSDLATAQIPEISLSTANNPPFVSQAVFVAQSFQVKDMAPANLTENASVAHVDSGQGVMVRQVAGLTVSPALVPSQRLVRDFGDGLVLTELLPRPVNPADGFAGMPPGLDDMSREELVDHIRDLTRALAWSESCLTARNQEVERLWTELEFLRNKNGTSTTNA